jgi:hypothetical protein
MATMIRRLTTATDQAAFLDSYFVCARRPPERQVFLRSVSADMFPRSHTAAYFLNGEMVGGYCVVLRPPLTELRLLPQDVRESHPFLLEASEEDMVSIPMLWLNKDLRGARHSVVLWRHMLTTIADTGRKYLVYGYQLQERQTWKLYKRAALPINLYEGILANGGNGGVDCVPIPRLARHIALLSKFSRRHMRQEEAIPA